MFLFSVNAERCPPILEDSADRLFTNLIDVVARL